MKKHIFIIISILVISTSINILTVTRAINTTETPLTTTGNELKEYIIKDYYGRLAVFETGNKKPIEIYDIFTSTLPEADAQNIKKGIKATPEKIEKLLSEYTS